MKILILSDGFPPQAFGGAGFSTFDLASGLQKLGHQIFVITICQEKSDEGSLDYQGLKVFRIFAKYHERWRAYLSLYNPQTVRKVRDIIKQISPDIVHANNIHFYISYYSLKIAKQHSKAVFLTARDVMPFNYEKLITKKYLEQFNPCTSWWDHFKQAQKRYNPFRNIIIRHYLKYVDKIFSTSYALKDALNRNGIQNIEVIYNGMDVDNWKVNPERIAEFKRKHGLLGKKILFFAARMNYLKGGKQIIQTVAKIKEEIPGVTLVVAGKKKGYAQEMARLAKELGLIDNIVFTGWLERDEIKAAYHSADVVVMPSICFESLGRVAIEGMACSKPVVATCYGGAPEVVQDGVTGYVINPHNIQLMVNKITDLLKNPQKAKEFGEAGYQRVKKHFSLDVHITQTLAWYKKYYENFIN